MHIPPESYRLVDDDPEGILALVRIGNRLASRPKPRLDGGLVYTVPPGTLVGSLKEFAKLFGVPTREKALAILKRLVRRGVLEMGKIWPEGTHSQQAARTQLKPVLAGVSEGQTHRQHTADTNRESLTLTKKIPKENPSPQGKELYKPVEKQPVSADFRPTDETRARCLAIRQDIDFENYWPWWLAEMLADGRPRDDHQGLLVNWFKAEKPYGRYLREQRAKAATPPAAPAGSAPARRGSSPFGYDLAQNIGAARGVLAKLRQGGGRPGDGPAADRASTGGPATGGGG